MRTAHLNRRTVILVTIFAILTLLSCSREKKPSPNPAEVLLILRNFPGSAVVDERTIPSMVDNIIRLDCSGQTTPEQVIAYYDPLLQALGFEENPSVGPTYDDLSVQYHWMYYGCPFHSIQVSVVPQGFHLTYTYGLCR